MKIFQKFLIFKQRLSNTLSDERKQANEASFFELTLTLERMLKRSLRPPELLILWDMDNDQTELLINLLQEAKSHETTHNP